MTLRQKQHSYSILDSTLTLSTSNYISSKKVNINPNSKSQQICGKKHLINLQFIGIGYRAYVIKPKAISPKDYCEKFLVLKVGQSGETIYPIPNNILIHCPIDSKADKEPIVLVSDNLQALQTTVAEIKSYRIPDPYKGSGILKCTRLQKKNGEEFVTEYILRKQIKKKK